MEKKTSNYTGLAGFDIKTGVLVGYHVLVGYQVLVGCQVLVGYQVFVGEYVTGLPVATRLSGAGFVASGFAGASSAFNGAVGFVGAKGVLIGAAGFTGTEGAFTEFGATSDTFVVPGFIGATGALNGSVGFVGAKGALIGTAGFTVVEVASTTEAGLLGLEGGLIETAGFIWATGILTGAAVMTFPTVRRAKSTCILIKFLLTRDRIIDGLRVNWALHEQRPMNGFGSHNPIWLSLVLPGFLFLFSSLIFENYWRTESGHENRRLRTKAQEVYYRSRLSICMLSVWDHHDACRLFT